MRISQWTVRIKGWSLVFERCGAKRPGPSVLGETTDDGQHVWTNAGPISWEDLRANYSAEDVKRWREQLQSSREGM